MSSRKDFGFEKKGPHDAGKDPKLVSRLSQDSGTKFQGASQIAIPIWTRSDSDPLLSAFVSGTDPCHSSGTDQIRSVPDHARGKVDLE